MPFFRFQPLMLVFAHGYSFETLPRSGKAFLGVQHEGKEKQTLSSTFWEAALLLDGFLRDIDSRSHAINLVLLAKYQIFIPLTSWCTTDDMTDKQTDNKGPWNLQETTSPPSNSRYFQYFDQKRWVERKMLSKTHQGCVSNNTTGITKP